MRFVLYISPIVLIILGATLFFERPAYAYADPGSGLLAIQAAGSALVATGWYLRRKILSFLRRGPFESHHEDLPKAEDGKDLPNT